MHSKSEVQQATLDYFNNDELATSTFFKYCLQDKSGLYLELTPDDMHWRLANEFARIEQNYPNPLSAQEIYEQLQHFSKIIPQGSPMYGIGNPLAVSLSNCFVLQSPEDNISSIVNNARDTANLSKRRGGVGQDLSKLRPTHTPVNNSAGTTSGSWSFADLYSYILNLIGQNGRRGAGMVSMHIKHPDALLFTKMKHDLTKVTGANISLRITDDFMIAVKDGTTFTQQWPINSDNPQIIQEIDARELWEEIVTSAKETAEPGLLMWDNISKNLPSDSYPGQEALTTNPCGEQALPKDSCRLITLNLLNFVKNPFTDFSYFEISQLKESCRIMMRLGDDLVDLEIEKLNQIIEAVDTPDEKALWQIYLESAINGRRTGLGTTALADTFAALGMPYDSTEALELATIIYSTLRDSCYRESINLAKERGSFPIFNWKFDKQCHFIQRLPQSIQDDLSIYGRRNIVLLTNAPTGSCSILAQTSSGIEPIFRLEYMRRKKINHNENKEIDFTDANGVQWQHFNVYHHNYKRWLDLNPNTDNSFWTTSDQIDWRKRIELQSVIQSYIDNSVSSTINLPKDTSIETVKELYMLAWEKGLKGVTVYVDGSRDGVLVSEQVSNFKSTKRPEELSCIVCRAKVKGQEWVFLVGLLDNKPYEVFGGKAEDIVLDESITKGSIKKYPYKTRNSRYDFIYSADNKTHTCKDLIKLINNNEYSTLTRFVSLSLRHNVPVQFISDQLNKNKKDTMLDFGPVLARTLKEFIPEGTTSSKACSQCSAHALFYTEGCLQCSNCGYAKCG